MLKIKNPYIISVDMGYGHQRAADNLSHIFNQPVIVANNYSGIPARDKKMWEEMVWGYNLISRFKQVPILGSMAFSIFDHFRGIAKFEPGVDLSAPTWQTKKIHSFIKKGLCQALIEKLKQQKRPLISTFYIPVMAGIYYNYPGEIYCQLCDSDVSRVWAGIDPKKSRVKFLAPTKRTKERLKLYGVKDNNIFLTGFPLPDLTDDYIYNRLDRLDLNNKSACLSIMFAVGGAGVQKEIGGQILKSLRQKIKQGKVKLIFSAGVCSEVNKYFKKQIKISGLKKGVEIIFHPKIKHYFDDFNQALKTIDVLWTKPSELSFYSGLGLPIIMSPPIGSQEKFNRQWLLKNGFGIDQKSLQKVDQWLFDLLNSKALYRAGYKGFKTYYGKKAKNNLVG